MSNNNTINNNSVNQNDDYHSSFPTVNDDQEIIALQQRNDYLAQVIAEQQGLLHAQLGKLDKYKHFGNYTKDLIKQFVNLLKEKNINIEDKNDKLEKENKIMENEIQNKGNYIISINDRLKETNDIYEKFQLNQEKKLYLNELELGIAEEEDNKVENDVEGNSFGDESQDRINMPEEENRNIYSNINSSSLIITNNKLLEENKKLKKTIQEMKKNKKENDIIKNIVNNVRKNIQKRTNNIKNVKNKKELDERKINDLTKLFAKKHKNNKNKIEISTKNTTKQNIKSKYNQILVKAISKKYGKNLNATKKTQGKFFNK